METRELSEKLDLALVHCIHLAADRSAPGELAGHRMSMELLYAQREDRLDLLFKAVCTAYADDDVEMARIEADVACAFKYDGDATEIPERTIVSYGLQVGLYAAYPYIRETIQDLASRLAISGLTVGLLKRGSDYPFELLRNTEDSND